MGNEPTTVGLRVQRSTDWTSRALVWIRFVMFLNWQVYHQWINTSQCCFIHWKMYWNRFFNNINFILVSICSKFTILRQSRQRWLGHFRRMKDRRIPKRYFVRREVIVFKRNFGCPELYEIYLTLCFWPLISQNLLWIFLTFNNDLPNTNLLNRSTYKKVPYLPIYP